MSAGIGFRRFASGFIVLAAEALAIAVLLAVAWLMAAAALALF